MRTPHTALIYPQDEVLAGALVKGYVDGEAVSIACQITPSDSTAVYEQFGVEVKDAWLFMANLGLESLFVVGAQIEYRGRRYVVASEAKPYIGFGRCDHFSCALEARND